MNLGLRDFFIGVIHLFVIFLPGAVLLLTLLYLHGEAINTKDDLGVELGTFGDALLFLGVSYFLGHLISLIASSFEDNFSSGFRKKEAGPAMAALRRSAHETCCRRLPRELVSAATLRRWAATLIRRESGSFQSNIDSKDADRRFFRNILLVLLLILLAVEGKYLVERISAAETVSILALLIDVGSSYDQQHLIFLAAVLFLSLLAYWRYADQDSKFTQLVFESLVVMDATKRNESGDKDKDEEDKQAKEDEQADEDKPRDANGEKETKVAEPSRANDKHKAAAFDVVSGGVVFDDSSWRAKYLIISPKDNGSPAQDEKEWVLPKGHLKDGETMEDAALREVYEETGKIAEICAFLDFTYFQVNGTNVQFANYLMRLADENDDVAQSRAISWKEDKKRGETVEIFGVAKAKLTFSESKSILKLAKKRVKVCRRNRLLAYFSRYVNAFRTKRPSH